MLAVEPQRGVSAGDAPGTRFGAYQLVEQVGEGGMGVVWRAEQHHPVRRLVAVKVMKPGGDSRQVLSRFEAERQALAILNHPNIAVVFDAGITPDGRPYFVMEYVPGLPITSFADRRALTISARLELFLQVCDGVEHAHQKGLLHRDLKPTNILVTDQDGRRVVKIIDFGVAKAIGPLVTAATIETQVGVLLGTPEYMSPEQAGLTEASVDTRTDIYSLGLVLYELLVGALPFDARELRRKAVLEMLRVIREDDPPRLTTRLTSQGDAEIQEICKRRLTEPRTLRRQLKGDLEWITGRALEKEPSRRYPSASELRTDVRRHLSNEPVAAGPPDLTYRLGKLARKHRNTAIAAGLALATLVVAAVVSTVLWISADRARRENRERLKALHVTTGLQLASDGDSLKALPWLVRALQLEEGGPRAEELHRIRIRHVLDGSPFPIRIWQHAGLVGAYLAPDRSSLATWDRNGTVKIWDSARGESIGPPLEHSAPLVDVRVAGSIVVTGDQRGIVRRWDPRTGKEVLPELTHAPDLRFVRMSLDSNRLLTVDGRGGIRVWALDSGRAVASMQHGTVATVAEFVGIGRTFAVGDGTGSVLIADSESGKVLSRLPHEGEVLAIVSTADDRVATASRGSVIRVWNPSTGALVFESARAIANDINELRVSRDWAFVCGDDGAVLAALGRTRSPQRLSAHVSCTSVDMSDDGLLVAMSYRDGAVRTWQAPALSFAPSLPHSGQVLLVRFLTESRRLVSVDSAGVIRVWDLSPTAPPPSTNGNLYTWTSTFSPDGRRVAHASGSSAPPFVGVATIHDATTGEAVLPPLRHGGNARTVAFSPDGKLIATGSDDATARLWDAATGEPLGAELAVLGGVGDLRFSPDGQRLWARHLSGSKVFPLSLYDVRSGGRIATLPESGQVRFSSFSPDSRHVSTVSRPAGRVQVWRTSDGGPVPGVDWAPFEAAAFLSNSDIVMVGPQSIELRRLDGTTIGATPTGVSGVEAIEVTRDGTNFVVASEDGTVRVFNARGSVTPRFPLWRLPGAISDGALSADNRWFAAASWQRRARVWSMETGEPVTPERAVALLPLSVSFSPKGPTFQVSGLGAQAWELRPDGRSLDVLEGIAQLLSGMELSGIELVTLPVDRLIRLVHDPRIAQTPSTSDERNWRWSAANAQLTERNWAAAATILATMARDPEAIWEMHASHGHALAELSRWSEAVHAFELALARRPDSTELIYYEALARAAGGDATAIDGACRAGLQKFGTTRNPDRAHWLASLCVLAAVPADSTRASVRDLARIAADVEPDLERFVTVHAAALLRAYDASRATAILDELLKRPAVRDRGAETLLVSAVAQRTLGQHSAATEMLARFDASPLRSTMAWYRRFEADIWRRELQAR
jgi:WD40 repeat protein/serine/threonine protein kinase